MKKKIILLLMLVAFCGGCGKSSNQSNDDINNSQQSSSEKENIENSDSKSGIYHYSDSDITPDRELESGEILIKIGGSKEFNLLDLTAGKILNNFNSSTGFTSKHIIDNETYNPQEVAVFEQYQEDKSNVIINFSINNKESYLDDNAKEKFLHKLVHEVTVSVSDTTLGSDFVSNISIHGISIGMTKEEVHSILGDPSSTSAIFGDTWYENYRYKDTKSWLQEHFNLSIRYNDNNQVIKMYISL